jgi:hypothetical protein
MDKYNNMEISSDLLEKKKVVFSLTTDKIKDFKRIAVEKEMTLNDLFVEGVECVLKRYKDLLK